MFNISLYLEKFKDVGLEKEYARSVCAESVKECTGITIGLKDINVRNGVFEISVSPSAKSEIFMKKSEIVEIMNKKIAQKIRAIF